LEPPVFLLAGFESLLFFSLLPLPEVVGGFCTTLGSLLEIFLALSVAFLFRVLMAVAFLVEDFSFLRT